MENDKLRRMYEAQKKDPMDLIDSVPLSGLLDVRKGAILTPDTVVSLYATKEKDHFEVMFHKPLKSENLTKMLKNFTDNSFSSKYVADLWDVSSGETDILKNPIAGLIEMSENPAMRLYGKKLGEVLESEDDTKFITATTRGLKSHSEAWKWVGSSSDFVNYLSRMVNSENPAIDAYKNEIAELIGNTPQIPKGRSSTTPNPTNGTQRLEIANSFLRTLCKDKEDRRDLEKSIIDSAHSIRFEYSPAYGEPVYFVGESDNVELTQLSENTISATSDRLGATIEIDETIGSIDVLPRQRNYIVPVMCFESVGDMREVSFNSNLEGRGDILRIPYKNGKTEVLYRINRDNISPLGGLLMMYDLFYEPTNMYKQKLPVPAEVYPFAALKGANSMLKRKFFERVERTVGK